ncbi:hypothetical protein NMG60_11015812 [Bertholletia excelsa]
MIAASSGQLITGILWPGELTVDRLEYGNELLKKRLGRGSRTEVSPRVFKWMRRVIRMTKTSERVTTGILSQVMKVSGFCTSSIVNSYVCKKFCSLLPGETMLASLDGYDKIYEAVEVAGKNVMTTSSVVITGLVPQRYGEEAGKVVHEGLEAAGHALGLFGLCSRQESNQPNEESSNLQTSPKQLLLQILMN